MFQGFFLDKKVLITGVAGVCGSWLSLMLLEAGARVTGVDIESPGEESNFRASGLMDRIDFREGDVIDQPLMTSLMKDKDCVFHLAAVSLVGEARRNPLEAFRTNTYGTAAVLDALRLSDSAVRAVLVTTDKVYKSKEGEAWKEEDPLFADGPYAISKACAEQIIKDYHDGYLSRSGKRIAVGRAGNVLVGGDFLSSRRTAGAGRIFVDCFDALMEGLEPTIYNPKFTRPYTYGLDVLSGYLALMSRLDRDDVTGEAFNFGPVESHGIKNAALADEICRRWGTGVTWRAGGGREEPFEKQSLSWEKARRSLDWRPAYALDEALRDTLSWYKEWSRIRGSMKDGDMYEFNRSLMHTHREKARKSGIPWAG